MTNEILKKCLDALSGENLDISYIRGMLETLIAMTPVIGDSKSSFTGTGFKVASGPLNIPGIPPIRNIEDIKKIAEESLS